MKQTRRQPALVSRRDPGRTQGRILAAALREFSAKGLAGARVDAIARRAGINKRMLYHYFGSKRGLFSAVLGRKLTERQALLASAPDDPAAALVYWLEAACKDMDWTRLLQWEALQAGDHSLVQAARRRDGARQAIEGTRRRQEQGFLNARFDPRHLLLSMIALTTYPVAFPQVTRLITGRSVTHPAFLRARRDFLREFAALLRPNPNSRNRRPA